MANDIQQLLGWVRTFRRSGGSDRQSLRPGTLFAGNDLDGAPVAPIEQQQSADAIAVGTLYEITDLPCIGQEEFEDYPPSIGNARSQFSTEAVARIPSDPHVEFDSILSRARALLERKDWAELQQCAELICADYADRPDGYLMAKAAQVGLGQSDTAEALLADAMTRFPTHEQIAIEHAWLAHDRRDWAEAKRRWETIRQSFRNRIEGCIGLGIAQRETECFDEADASFTEAIVRFPDNQAALIEFAWVAHNRGDLVEARRRWMDLRDRFPDNRYGYVGAGVSERAAGDTAAAEALLAEGHTRFPADEGIAVAYGWMANIRQDWDTSLARLTSLKQRFPDNEEIGRALEVAHRGIEQREASTAGDHVLHDQLSGSMRG